MARRPHRNPESDLRRPAPSRTPRKSILVVCEGAKTEPNYFESLRKTIGLTTVEVKVFGAGAEIVGVLREAIKLKEKRDSEARLSNQLVPFDEVWCVVDTEQGGNRGTWNEETEKARNNSLQLAWSNPCFEYWLLLHFECSGSVLAGYTAVRKCLRQHIKNYEKHIDCFEHLASRIPIAIEHSLQIHKTQWQHTPHPLDCNPGTRVHELAETLIEAAGMTVREYETRFPLAEKPRKGATKKRSRREGR